MSAGHTVTLLTSHPEIVRELIGKSWLKKARWRERKYDTITDLRQEMGKQLLGGTFTLSFTAPPLAIIWLRGYSAVPGTRFTEQSTWHAAGEKPRLSSTVLRAK